MFVVIISAMARRLVGYLDLHRIRFVFLDRNFLDYGPRQIVQTYQRVRLRHDVPRHSRNCGLANNHNSILDILLSFEEREESFGVIRLHGLFDHGLFLLFCLHQHRVSWKLSILCFHVFPSGYPGGQPYFSAVLVR